MRLRSTSGGIVDATGEEAERLMALGYAKADEKPPQTTKKAAARKPAARKAATK